MKSGNWKKVLVLLCVMVCFVSCSVQKADRTYDVSIKNPAFSERGPAVLYDEAHLNTHSSRGTYKPFVDLITNDGYSVAVNTEKFSREILPAYDLLIICNAKSHKDLPRDVGAFTREECEAVNDYVREGGSLLLIADHHPFGLANRSLALLFGVEMGGGSVKDGLDKNGLIEFTRSNGLLLDHTITNGFNKSQKINKVVTFTGQSLKGNEDILSILTLGKNSKEVRPDSIWQKEDTNHITFGKPVSVAGLSQAVAIEFGKGRVVVLGDAAMLSAQKLFGRKFGMNYPPGNDNKQFALNIMHWLTKYSAENQNSD